VRVWFGLKVSVVPFKCRKLILLPTGAIRVLRKLK